MKTIEHKKLGVTARLADLTQGQLEKYQETLLADDKKPKSAAGFNSLVALAAIDAGFLLDIESSAALKDWKPPAVRWLTEQVIAFVKEQTEVPLEE